MKQPTIHENHSLRSYNTFGIDAKTRYYAEAKSVENLQSLLDSTTAKKTELFVLGGGSNILLTQDFAGLTIRVLIPGIEVLREDAHHVWLKIGSGENWHELVQFCVKHNWGGVENLALIPGTVGAAPIQNIGAYGVELKDCFEELQAVCIKTNKIKNFNHRDCEFGYRNSIFKNSHKNQFIISSVILRLDKNPKFHVSYGAVAETLEKMQAKPSLNSIMEAVMQIRRSKLPDPKEIGNAGSFFKNPEISQKDFKILQNKYPAMPNYAVGDDHVKIPAGWLIEQCGWKGKRSGNIGVYPKQALVIVNYGQASGKEIKSFSEEIQNSVYEKFGINLVTEVNIL